MEDELVMFFDTTLEDSGIGIIQETQWTIKLVSS